MEILLIRTMSLYLTLLFHFINILLIIISDPLYSGNAWVYEMVNIVPVWKQGIYGAGIRVRVNDDGVAGNHTEFEGRFNESTSCDNWAPTDSFHGTSVASIIASAGDNGVCGVGISPKVELSACNIYDGGNEAFLAEKVNDFDISQNSIGASGCGATSDSRRRRLRRQLQVLNNNTCPFQFSEGALGVFPCSVCTFDGSATSTSSLLNTSSVCGSAIVDHCTNYYEKDVPACLEYLELFLPGGRCDYSELTQVALDAMTTGILQGRDGKGIIYIFSSGNSFQSGDDTNLKGYTNNRFAITVGAVGKDGIHASYSTPGASLFVAAPGGDYENLSNFITADFEGGGGGCRDAGAGTSFASPVVTGVVALMLEANPDLTWRDVQGILATTSRMLDAANDDNDDDETRVTNGANLTHSNLYGFGVVDATAAVQAAKTTWQLYSPERRLVGESGVLNIALLDDAVTTSSTIPIRLEQLTSDDFFVESVEVYIALKHFSRGDLEIILTSPQGTESILHPGQRPENTVLNLDIDIDDNDEQRWKLLTVRSWGESAEGNWTLAIRDISAGDAFLCADAPFRAAISNFVLTCDYMETTGFCADGAVDESSVTVEQLLFLRSLTDDGSGSDTDGKGIEESCCACGGGLLTDEFEDILQQWQLVVYGREFPYDASISMAPSDAPSMAPSLSFLLLTPAPTPPASPPGDPNLSRLDDDDDPDDGDGGGVFHHYYDWNRLSVLLLPLVVVTILLS
jgi:subtilisin family serine protease